MPVDKVNKKKYQKKYQAKPAQKAGKALRHQARKDAVNAGRVRKGDGKEVDHRTPIKKGGGNKSNTRVMSRTGNRKKGSK